MSKFSDREFRELERRLRAERPEPSDSLLSSLTARPRSRNQFALAAAMTAVLLVAVASVGGVSYAAKSLQGAVKVAKKAVSPAKGQQAIVIRGLSAGGDQYQPGFGFGDDNHNHSGPPGLQRQGGDKAPPLQSNDTNDGKAKVAGTSVTFDEQAHLYISVVDPNGEPLLLTQKSKRGSTKIGGQNVDGPQTKFIQYVVLVPRSIPISVRVPDNLLKPGVVYRIRIVAIDPDGNKSTLFIPFRG